MQVNFSLFSRSLVYMEKKEIINFTEINFFVGLKEALISSNNINVGIQRLQL